METILSDSHPETERADGVAEAGDFLTTRQFAAKYRVEGRVLVASWYLMLEAWRDQQKLIASRDWKIAVLTSRNPQRIYHEPRVLRLIWTSDRLFAQRVKISNMEAIRAILAQKR